MTNDYGIYDRYSDEMQNLSLRAREYECGSMLKKERTFFGFTEGKLRAAEELCREKDERGFDEER